MRNIGIDGSKPFIDLTLKLYNDVRALELPELRLTALRDEFANPTPKNVNWIVGLLGKKDYLERVAIRLDGKESRAETLLGEIAKRRNQIAHGDSDQVPSIEDVKRLRRFCLMFSNRLYKDLTRTTLSFMDPK